MDLVEETHKVPQVGVCIVLSANGLGGGLYSSRPCRWDFHALVKAVRGNLVSDEVLEGLHVRHGNSDTALGQARVILVIVYHNAFPTLMFTSVDRLSNRSINEEINTAALGAFRTAVASAAAMFTAFVDAVVVAVAMAIVMDSMKGCMMPVNAVAESSISSFASASESSVPGLIAAGSAAGGCLLRPLIFSLFVALLNDDWV